MTAVRDHAGWVSVSTMAGVARVARPDCGAGSGAGRHARSAAIETAARSARSGTPESGMRRPRGFSRRVRCTRFETAWRLHVAQRFGVTDLGGEVSQDRQLLHHAEVVWT